MKGKLIGALLGSWITFSAQGFEIEPSDWEAAMELGRIDSELLYAIALQESGTSFNGRRQYGPWPWTMNISGEGKFYASKTAMTKALEAELKANNEMVAVGMWQIHLKYNAHLVDHPTDLTDPSVNLRAASQVIESCGNKYKTTRDVLSCYYSGDVDEAGVAYAKRVIKLARKWGQPFDMHTRPGFVHFSVAEYDGIDRADEPQLMPARAVTKPAAAPKESRSNVGSSPFKTFLKRLDSRAAPSVRRVVYVVGEE